MESTLDVPGIEAIAIVGGILLGALFAAVEAGLTALGDVFLQVVRDDGGRQASVAARALRQRSAIRARLLAGRVLSLAVAVASATVWGLQVGGVPAAAGAALGAAFLYTVVAELAITVARQRASRSTLVLLRALRWLELLLMPLALPLEWVGRVTARLVPEIPPDDSARLTERAVEHVIEQGEETGSIAEDHAELLRSVLEFKNTVAKEVMVPRTQTVAFDLATPVHDAMTRIMESGHSRYPVYRDRIDQVDGVLYAKDLFRALREHSEDEVRLESLVRRPVFFVGEDQKIGSLLKEMQQRRVHLAVVVDEFGGTSGIVTLEDILEEIVGEIRDEHDEEEVRVEELAPGRYLVDAGISIHDLEDVVGESVHDADGDEADADYESLGGMVVELAGRVPSVGESLRVGKYDVLVREADERHVVQVELVRRADADDVQAAE